MKKFKLDANIGNIVSYDENFDDMELLVCNPKNNIFFVIEEDRCNTYTIEAESYNEAIAKMLKWWYPETYEEWTENDDGDLEPASIMHEAIDFYTITEAETIWNHEVIKL